jgi:UDP-3-O-[3-hydroxymyristoyl] N-acetylglucosamine deacetylase/3-hydroxyacyl-[acyl-carrier-protein] dehydratase
MIRKAGLVEQDAGRAEIVVREPVSVTEGDATLAALPATGEGLTVSYTLNYEHTPIGSQHFTIAVQEGAYAREIAPARTFCLQTEVEELRRQGMGKGATAQNTLVVGEGGVIDNQLRFPNEFVRHKILDLIGDLSLAGRSIRAHVVGVRSGHSANVRLAGKLARLAEEGAAAPRRPETLLDVRELFKVLPHRYPFLLIDKVVELEGWQRAVGIKNVTINEPFFQGHFPGRPIMPGVLQIEAMAQLAGALLMRKADNANKLAVLLSMDEVKLRKTVVPGDQLRIEADVEKLKARTGTVRTRATVDGQVVSEAILKFMLVDPE